MKKIRKLILLLIVGILFIPNVVFAASGTLSVSSASTGVVGNQLTVTVTLSSSTAIGSWEFDVSYDKSYLQLTSSTAESGGTHAVNYSGSGGIKSKSYTYKFKVLKSGSTTVRVTSSDVYAYNDESNMSMSNGSKTITLKTQEEIEASYSKDAYLKLLGVEGYSITPEFDKEKYEYELEVPNEVEKVTINAKVNDSNASLAGAGEKELIEGPNKFDIVVTAQKGNSLTYTITVTRKELDPIKVTVDNKELSIVRRKDTLPTELTGMVEKTVTYEGEEIPALYSDITDITVVGVKNESGDVFTYIYEDGKITNPYIELSSNIKGIVPLNVEANEDFKEYSIKEIEIEGLKIKAFVLNDNSNFAVIYALDANTNEKNYYTYDSKSKAIMLYNDEIAKYYKEKLNLYSYIILGGIGVMIFLLLIILFRKPSKKDKKSKEDPELVEEIQIEEVEEKPKKEKNKKSKLKDLLYEEEDEIVEVKDPEEDHLDNTKKIDDLLEKIENDKKDTKVKSVEDEVDDDTFVKTKKINLDEVEEAKASVVEETAELSKREKRKLEKEEKKKAKKEAKEQKKLLDRDEF